MDEKRIEDAEKIIDEAIRVSGGSINCKVGSHKDEKYQVRLFTNKNELIGGRGINIPEEWIKDSNPKENLTHGKLKILLRDLEQEARRERR